MMTIASFSIGGSCLPLNVWVPEISVRFCFKSIKMSSGIAVKNCQKSGRSKVLMSSKIQEKLLIRFLVWLRTASDQDGFNCTYWTDILPYSPHLVNPKLLFPFAVREPNVCVLGSKRNKSSDD